MGSNFLSPLPCPIKTIVHTHPYTYTLNLFFFFFSFQVCSLTLLASWTQKQVACDIRFLPSHCPCLYNVSQRCITVCIQFSALLLAFSMRPKAISPCCCIAFIIQHREYWSHRPGNRYHLCHLGVVLPWIIN